MDKRFRLDGQVALVTGASSGLGRHFSKVLAGAGARVVVAARRVALLETLVAEIRSAGGEAFPQALDVGDESSIVRCFDAAETQAGGIDVLVNNAGTTVTRAFLDLAMEDWDAVLNANLRGAFRVAQEAARRMVKAAHGGSIVNISSIVGERPAGSLSAYATSKAALSQLTKSMALELARHKIRVNALAPGYVSTELNAEFLAGESGQKLMARIPQRRFGRPEDLDGPLLLLASAAGEYMTGTILVVDGGHLVSAL